MKVPQGWRMANLGSLTPADRKIVYGIVQAGPFVEDGIPYIRSTDVGGKLVATELLRTSPSIALKYSRSEVREGDIVFSLRGNIGETSIVPPELNGANLTQGTARISLNGDVHNHFVRYALCEYHVRKRINVTAKGSTFREITIEDLRNVEIPLAPIEEQRQIAEIIGKWDSALEVLESLLVAKVDRKRWLMQQLLTGQTRSKEFKAEPWQKMAIGHLLESREVHRVKSASLPLYSLTIESGVTPKSDRYDREALVNDKDGKEYKVVEPGDIVFNPSNLRWGAIGISREKHPVLVSPIYEVLKLKDEVQTCRKFVFQLLSSPRQIAIFATKTEGTLVERMAVKLSAFLHLKVEVPTNADEQRRIAEVLETCDREIELLQKKLEALKEQKRGLMQKLLTGQIRVKINNTKN